MAATESVRAFVAFVCCKDSDAPTMQHTITELDELQIPCEKVILQPGGIELAAYVDEAKSRGLRIVIAGNYLAYTDELIPTILETEVPIIRVVTGPRPASLDKVALNNAFAGFGSDGAINAALSAARVLALTDPGLSERLRARPQPSFWSPSE
jgi:5-(carboxyamino)imidazole ribonucleotide mutase